MKTIGLAALLAALATPAMAQEHTSMLWAQIKCQELGEAKRRTPRNQEAERKLDARQPFEDHFYRAFYSKKNDQCVFLAQTVSGAVKNGWTAEDGVDGTTEAAG